MSLYKDMSPAARAKARQWQHEHQHENTLRHRDRAMAEKKFGAAALKGKDVDHTKPIDQGGQAGTGAWDNLRVISVKKNRGYPRDARNQPSRA